MWTAFLTFPPFTLPSLNYPPPLPAIDRLPGSRDDVSLSWARLAGHGGMPLKCPLSAYCREGRGRGSEGQWPNTTPGTCRQQRTCSALLIERAHSVIVNGQTPSDH